MKRVLAGAGICAAMTVIGMGTAAADDGAAATGSASTLPVLLLNALSSGSAQPCDGIMLDVCTPIGPASAEQAVAQPIADSGSALLPDLSSLGGNLIGWLANGSSEPCYSFGPNCAWE
ncbi:hypothetical protein AB0I35_28655 [Nocardia sp. NPDC050378]|uniref:hypothetical protein n=1 Tax=Nocardia sp. NPDC050378 TaxID=3155400 RepID=UPI0033EC667E